MTLICRLSHIFVHFSNLLLFFLPMLKPWWRPQAETCCSLYYSTSVAGVLTSPNVVSQYNQRIIYLSTSFCLCPISLWSPSSVGDVAALSLFFCALLFWTNLSPSASLEYEVYVILLGDFEKVFIGHSLGPKYICKILRRHDVWKVCECPVLLFSRILHCRVVLIVDPEFGFGAVLVGVESSAWRPWWWLILSDF